MWFFRVKSRPIMHCSLNVLQYERFEEIFLIVLIKQLSVNVQRETCRCHIIAYSSFYHEAFRVDIQDIKHCSPNVPQYKCFYEIFLIVLINQLDDKMFNVNIIPSDHYLSAFYHVSSKFYAYKWKSTLYLFINGRA